ncbi:hypothetical protein C7974DRAFT_236038 [Boeremia exigua]|uniref:uncharacterized protein n=1 Tax=Boeremia exigua TaxID=749465 RepID=UPI001E8D7D50|nr:uncharacterized protein C7974DRAFT_236038 [Boeremia exigua]KAH6620563.1 hypothetical protein C7974DRAFT_236038 [Boeremia exigua]
MPDYQAPRPWVSASEIATPIHTRTRPITSPFQILTHRTPDLDFAMYCIGLRLTDSGLEPRTPNSFFAFLLAVLDFTALCIALSCATDAWTGRRTVGLYTRGRTDVQADAHTQRQMDTHTDGGGHTEIYTHTEAKTQTHGQGQTRKCILEGGEPQIHTHTQKRTHARTRHDCIDILLGTARHWDALAYHDTPALEQTAEQTHYPRTARLLSALHGQVRRINTIPPSPIHTHTYTRTQTSRRTTHTQRERVAHRQQNHGHEHTRPAPRTRYDSIGVGVGIALQRRLDGKEALGWDGTRVYRLGVFNTIVA